MMEAMANSPEPHHIRVQGKKPFCVPVGTQSYVPVACPKMLANKPIEFLVEPLGPDDGFPPEGLLVSPSLVKGKVGEAFVPITNVSKTDVWLTPCQVIATVQLASMSAETNIGESLGLGSC